MIDQKFNSAQVSMVGLESAMEAFKDELTIDEATALRKSYEILERKRGEILGSIIFKHALGIIPQLDQKMN